MVIEREMITEGEGRMKIFSDQNGYEMSMWTGCWLKNSDKLYHATKTILKQQL